MWFQNKPNQKWHEVLRIVKGETKAFCGATKEKGVQSVSIKPVPLISRDYCGACRNLVT